FEGFKLDLAYAWLNTKLVEAKPIVLASDSPFASITPSAEGGPLPLSPNHRATATASYRLPLDQSVGNVSFSATYTYTSKQVAYDTSLYGVMPETHLLNLSVNWNSVLGSPVDAAFFMTNVTNAEFPVNVAGNWLGSGYEAYITNEPRMWGFRLKYRFGN
ncbi:MAG: TonB-dependent receptor, partial [Novosphingobium sp.]|nr:TonB-dependent receptor [Novosphingobium sp.]